MTTRAEQPPATSAAFILKIGTAILMMFAATLVLVHAEIYFLPSADNAALHERHLLSRFFSLEAGLHALREKDRALGHFG